MKQLALNDFFAKTRLLPDDGRLSDILSFYDASSVSRVFFAVDYDPDMTVSSHLLKRSKFDKAMRAMKRSVKISTVSVIPIIKNISQTANFEKLSFASGDERYLFINILPTSDSDMIISELHSIIYDYKFIPVITGTEITALSIPESAASSVYRIPRAVYQINFSSLSEKSVRSLAKTLIDDGKTVVFGSGSKFDTCPYANPAYYTKLISRTVGADTLGYFTLRHNRVFH